MKNFTAPTRTFLGNGQPAYGSSAKKIRDLSNQPTRPTFAQFLPSTGRAFFVYLIGLLTLCGCLALYIQLSVQILEAEADLYQQETIYYEINQQNTHIVWRISQASTLTRVQERANVLEYKLAASHHYVQASTLPAITLQSATQQPVTSNQQPANLTLRIQTFLEAASRYFYSWQQPNDYQAHQS